MGFTLLFFPFLSPNPSKEALAEALEEDLCQSLRDLGAKASGQGMHMCDEQGRPEESVSLTSLLRDCSVLTVNQVTGGEGNFPSGLPGKAFVIAPGWA